MPTPPPGHFHTLSLLIGLFLGLIFSYLWHQVPHWKAEEPASGYYAQQADSLARVSARLAQDRALLLATIDSVTKHRENEISRMDSLHIDSVLRLLAAD